MKTAHLVLVAGAAVAAVFMLTRKRAQAADFSATTRGDASRTRDFTDDAYDERLFPRPEWLRGVVAPTYTITTRLP